MGPVLAPEHAQRPELDLQLVQMKAQKEKEENEEECLEGGPGDASEGGYHLGLEEHLSPHIAGAHDCIGDQLYDEIPLCRQEVQGLNGSYPTV